MHDCRPGVPRHRGALPRCAPAPGQRAPVRPCAPRCRGTSSFAGDTSCPSPPTHNRKHHHHGVRRRPKLHDGGRQNYCPVDATDDITTGPQREFRGRRGCVLDATHRLLQRPGELNTRNLRYTCSRPFLMHVYRIRRCISATGV
jgi:hypothetical protein